MEKKADVIAILDQVVAENTHTYRSDLDFDEKRLRAAMLEDSQEDRTFLWMSRPCGTWCFLECEVFMQGTLAHKVWTYYDFQASQIKAYRIIVAPGRPGAFVLGKLQPLNYERQVERVKQYAVSVEQIAVDFGDGHSLNLSFKEYQDRAAALIAQYGQPQKLRYIPRDEAELAAVLQKERQTKDTQKRKPAPKRRAPAR